MPADFFIDAPRGMVFSRASGELTHADALGHMDRLLRHPDFRPELNQLLDCRQVTQAILSSEEIRQLAERTIFSAQSRRSFVVASDFEFGICRMFATHRELAGEPGIRIFREMKPALAWLGLPAEPDDGLFAKSRLLAGEA